MNADLVEGFLVVRDVAVGMIQRRFQPVELKRSDLIA